MTGLCIQDNFEPYYAGRANARPKPAGQDERDAERREAGRKLAERAKRPKSPPLADVVGSVDPSP